MDEERLWVVHLRGTMESDTTSHAHISTCFKCSSFEWAAKEALDFAQLYLDMKTDKGYLYETVEIVAMGLKEDEGMFYVGKGSWL